MTMPASALTTLISSAPPPDDTGAVYDQHLHNLALQIQHNLQYQHDWTALTLHTHTADGAKLLPRPLISGIPPRRVYIHPDEQIELIKAGIKDEDTLPHREWVLPSHLREKWTLAGFAAVFDAIESVPPVVATGLERNASESDVKWRQVKRLLLATVDDDSTIVYYIMHDGVIKPRQN